MRHLFLASMAGLLFCRAAHSQDLARALDRPLSAGSVALLVSHASEPAVREHWAAALRDPRPEVRAAAARVINVSGAAPLLDDLKRALQTEAHWDAAREEMQAYAVVAGNADEVLLAAARRLGESGAAMAAEAMARARGTEALSSLPALRGAGLKSYDNFFSWATRGGTQNLTAAGSTALRDGVAAEWDAVLALAHRPGAVLDPGVLLAAVLGSDEAIRAGAYWHLALVKTRGGSLDDRLSGALTATLDGERPKDLAVGLPLEMLGRALGRKAVEQRGWIAALAKDGVRAPFAFKFDAHPALLDLLHRSELEALSAVTRGDPKALSKTPRHQRPDLSWRETDSSVSTVDGFPRGYVASVLEAAGCDPRGAHGVAAAQAAYGPDGRPRQIALANPGHNKALGGPPSCEEAARVLLVSALRETSRPTPPKTMLVLLQADALSCLAEERPAHPAEVSRDESQDEPSKKSGIQPPKKLRNVSPEYPSSAQDLKIDGVVVLQATISPTGCIRSLDVVRGIPTLNWEAMRAVAQWRYTPTLLNGTPVPVIMTVTVNFKLGRR